MKHSSTRPSRRTILLAAVWAMLILLDFAGLFWNISRLSEGAIGTAKFYKTLLHFGISLFSISAVYLAQWLLCFRAGTPVVIACALFAFGGNTVANVWCMYDFFPAWDMVLHSLSGVLFAVLGLGLASVLLRNQPKGTRKLIATVLLALFCSLTIGYLWELFEFTVDTVDPASSTQGWADGILESYPDGIYLVNSRRGTAILDTMEDMLLHLAGSLVTLVPLCVLFLKRPQTMDAFSFVPRPRRAPSAAASARTNGNTDDVSAVPCATDSLRTDSSTEGNTSPDATEARTPSSDAEEKNGRGQSGE